VQIIVPYRKDFRKPSNEELHMIRSNYEAGLKLQGILFNLQKAGSKLVKEDITYILRNIRGEESAYPPMHRLQLKYSENEEYVCIGVRNESSQAEVNALVILSKASLELMRTYHQIIEMDGTFKIIKGNVQCYNIVGVTADKTAFPIGVIFMSQSYRDVDDYYRVFEILVSNFPEKPLVIVVDREFASINAIEYAYE
jgi:hypothetical protein